MDLLNHRFRRPVSTSSAWSFASIVFVALGACLLAEATICRGQGWTGADASRVPSADPAIAWGTDSDHTPGDGASYPVQQATATSHPISRWAQPSPAAPSPSGEAAPKPPAAGTAPRPAAVETTGYLPQEHGQVWTEYDIRPYTIRVTETTRPEQAIVSWILHTTGWESWHGETLAILNANESKLRVYHTPEMQQRVAQIVQRFVGASTRNDSFSLKIVSVGHPEWRERFHALLRPTPVQTPGVGAWIISRETAEQVSAELQRRSDFREHSAPYFAVSNGQPGIVSSTVPHSYVKDVQSRPEAWPGYVTDTQVIDSGFALEFVPLMDLDGKSVEATIRLDINQLEKMTAMTLDMPTDLAPRQRTKIEIPQMTHFRMHEKFRWPLNQVLLIDLGMIALPTPTSASNPLGDLPIPLGGSESRANVLIFIESRAPVGPVAGGTPSPVRTTLTPSTRGRY